MRALAARLFPELGLDLPDLSLAITQQVEALIELQRADQLDSPDGDLGVDVEGPWRA
ncbi:hypothetical protein SAMN04487818_105442 [Actinokineospora terrae]|uniref:Uncharacterized protein n=1 Tax=Actinokineospora terrae TaxID=155974 RepID=A0A1H9SIB0_9PSEU|nr:hypothetical protein SAMN04487818_105442 [Actinokineospora terrae]